MAFTIEIVTVTCSTVPTAKGSYECLEVYHKKDGEAQKPKKVMSFVNKEVFNTLKKASAGDVFTVTAEKDAKDYWQWTKVVSGAAPSSSSSSASSAPAGKVVGSNWETAEERAKKQVYIVRQSSISAAVALLADSKIKATPEDVIATAKKFEAYVFATELADIPDDKPWESPDGDGDVPM